MSAESAIAAVDDSGANTASEVRAALTSILEASPEWVRLLSPESSTTSDDDYFDDASLTGWTTLNTSGTYTATEGNGVYSVNMTAAGSANDYNAIGKAVTISVGDIWETCVRIASDIDSLGLIFGGIAMSDGIVATSNLAAMEVGINEATDTTSQIVAGRKGTFTNEVSSGSGLSVRNQFGLYYLRIKYTASNSFDVYFSPDGVSWKNVTTISQTLTPTHIALVWNSWNETPGFRVATFEYVRKV